MGDIAPADVRELLREYCDRPAMALSLLVVARRLFGWAINQDYGLEHAPTDRLKARVLVGQRNMRARDLATARSGQYGTPISNIRCSHCSAYCC